MLRVLVTVVAGDKSGLLMVSRMPIVSCDNQENQHHVGCIDELYFYFAFVLKFQLILVLLHEHGVLAEMVPSTNTNSPNNITDVFLLSFNFMNQKVIAAIHDFCRGHPATSLDFQYVIQRDFLLFVAVRKYLIFPVDK